MRGLFRKRKLKTAGYVFLTAIGVVSGVVGILAAPNDLRTGSLSALVVLIFLLLVWITVTGGEPLFAEYLNELVPYRVEPAKPEDVDWIGDLEADVYSHDAVPRNTLSSWYDRNPRGFFVVTMEGQGRIGHINILALHPEVLELFRKGAIVEREILSTIWKATHHRL